MSENELKISDEVIKETQNNLDIGIKITALESSIDTEIKNKFSNNQEILARLETFKTSKSIEELKNDISILNPTDDESKELEKIYPKILELNKLKEQTKSNIDKLRFELNETLLSNEIKKEDLIIKKFIPKEKIDIFLRLINEPQTPIEQIIGSILGAAESILVVVKLFYDVVFGFIKSPIDVIRLAKKEAKYDGFDKV